MNRLTAGMPAERRTASAHRPTMTQSPCRASLRSTSCWATAVYLDPFSPKANPEAWSLPVLLKLRKSLKRGGRLATYSAQGAFRRALREAGFAVHRVPGVGKREWTVGIARGAPPG